MGEPARTVLMVKATHLAANPETRASNAFQSSSTAADAAARGLREQEMLAEKLQQAGVDVVLIDAVSPSPDGVFPNNWFSTHEDGRLVFYAMEAPSRRTEVAPDLAEKLRAHGYRVNETLDLRRHVVNARFLEGTGSLVLDRAQRVAYAALSSRTDAELVKAWAEQFEFRPCLFRANDPKGQPVYHTNVIMALGPGLAVVCLDVVDDLAEREMLRASLEASGREILEIDWQQVCAFAGNQLFLQGKEGAVVALSVRADAALRPEQKIVIDRHAERIVTDVSTIEDHGGGSVRCMLAEIFLPQQQDRGIEEGL